MEGPTARECLLFSAVDDDEDIAAFFIAGPDISIDGDRHTTSRLFGPYRPDETTARGSPSRARRP